MITLKSLPFVTAQEVFDQVVRNLLIQGKKSVLEDTDNVCRYRGDDGSKCAAGWLIGDDEYKRAMEEKIWIDVIQHCGVSDNHKQLISRLQDVHDHHTVQSWPDALKIIAKLFNLQYMHDNV